MGVLVFFLPAQVFLIFSEKLGVYDNWTCKEMSETWNTIGRLKLRREFFSFFLKFESYQRRAWPYKTHIFFLKLVIICFTIFMMVYYSLDSFGQINLRMIKHIMINQNRFCNLLIL